MGITFGDDNTNKIKDIFLLRKWSSFAFLVSWSLHVRNTILLILRIQKVVLFTNLLKDYTENIPTFNFDGNSKIKILCICDWSIINSILYSMQI